MGSPSLYSARKTTLALAVALSFAWQSRLKFRLASAGICPRW